MWVYIWVVDCIMLHKDIFNEITCYNEDKANVL